MSRLLTKLPAALVLPFLFSCAVTPPGASDAHLAQAKSRAARGAALFDASCAGCHGPRGEGLAGAPPILGATDLPRYPRDQGGLQLYQDPNQVQRQNQDRVPGVASRVEFVSAQDVQGYLKEHLGLVKAGASNLSEEDSWALINFLLIAHGSNVPNEEISAANARDVAIRVP
jgi:mono/diheme cytochrome c family protein